MSGDAGPNTSAREAPDVATRPVVLTVVGFLLFVGLTLAGLRIYYAWEVPGPVTDMPRTFPEPRLQASPRTDLDRLQAGQRQSLGGYAWVDRAQGRIRIPIERAMDLLAARGAQAYAPLDPPAAPSPVRPQETRP